MKRTTNLVMRLFLVELMVMQSLVAPAMAAPGGTITTPQVPPELPVEVETELAPGSLKQAPLWKELAQLLDDPYTPIVRRPGFGVTMPPLNVYAFDRNVNTNQPMRLRTNDGEICWDQPGWLFDPDEVVPVDANNVPLQLRTVIGELVPEDAVIIIDSTEYTIPNGNLVVRNPETDADADPEPDVADPRIPPDGTIVAVPAVINGQLYEYDPDTGDRELVIELETPINENDFIVDRAAAEVLGKALFWDMQVGSDRVQACGSCHFHAGVDNRTRNQLNPNDKGGDLTLQVRGPNEDVEPLDFPFHNIMNPKIPGEPLLNPENVIRDANDVMSSMGVIFRTFVDIPTPGPGAFGPMINGVAALLPDIGVADPDPIPVFQGFRRVEPRNTPTFHGPAFNFDNFWDGRARFEFNGGSVAGVSDPQFHIFITTATGLEGASNGHIRPDLILEDPEVAEQPVRIKFSSLASQAVAPPLSNFEMSFDGRNWAKIAKSLLQDNVVPLASQLVDPTDSVLGPFSNQNITPGMPGLSISYWELIELAFRADLWNYTTQHLDGAPDPTDPFDGYSLSIAGGAADPTDTNEFTQMEANFSLFFGLSVQAYEQLTIPDDSPFDQFMDANPLASNGVAQPGEQGTLFPTLVRELVTGSPTGTLNMVEGFGEDELFGFDIFAGANLTAALPAGSKRNPDGFGSNPFMRTARCMICHLGPEQTDASINVAHGLMLSDTEFEFPTPPTVIVPVFGEVGAPEPTGPFKTVSGFVLAEEVEEVAQDAVEVEPRDMALVDDPATSWDDRVVAGPSHFAFGDQGIYNVAVRPSREDLGRGENDPFGFPLSRSNLAMKNLAGPLFEPPNDPTDLASVMANFNPDLGFGGGLFDETGGGLFFPTTPTTTHTLQSINPGLAMEPTTPLMPAYMAPWLNNLPAGELHPQIDELAMVPNTLTPPNGGPAIEFSEILFGADLHCGIYDPVLFGAGPPNNGWGPRCPNNQTGVPNNFDPPLQGTWPFANRIASKGQFKAPSLRNVELTGPYFHTGSYLTLRQVVDFYLRGGDFPVTNAEHRDAHMLAIDLQAFGFGSTNDLPPNFIQDALPDVISRYDAMPDTDHPVTPEPATSTPEQARMALVKFLIALTDARVKFERAPFDRPEIFVPIDGTAPDNIGGREGYLADARFMHVPALGAAGRVDPLPNFLGVSSTPVIGLNNDHFDPNPTLDCVIIDNGDPGTWSVGTWRVSDGTNPWGPDSVYSLSAGDTFTFGTDLPGAQYGIYMRWTKTPNRRTSIPVEIHSDGILLDMVTVNQQQNPSQWNLLGNYTLGANTQVTIRSLGGGSTNADAVLLTPVPLQTELIIDNRDAGASSLGTWRVSGGANPWSSNSVYSRTAGDTFSFEGVRNGENNVYMWWTAWPSRSDAVDVQIFDGASLLDMFTVNQQANASQWNLLGAYTFTGTAGVTITATGSDTSTNADAVRFGPVGGPALCSLSIIGPSSVPEGSTANYDVEAIWIDGTTSIIEPNTWGVIDSGATISPTGLLTAPQVDAHTPITVTARYAAGGITRQTTKAVQIIDLDSPREIIVDNNDAGAIATGTWPVSGGANPYGTDSLYSRTTGNTFEWTADLVPGAQYAVFMWWTTWSSRRTNLPVEILSDSTLLETVTVNQRRGGGQWNLLGFHMFNSTATVRVRALSGFSTNADAVRFVPVSQLTEIIVDNRSPGATPSGTWRVSGGANPIGEDSVWSRTVDDTFTFDVGTIGTFDVQMWWTAWSSRYDSVPVEIYDGATLLDTITVDQTANAAQWNSLGAYTFTTGAQVRIISEATDSSTNADAVRLVPQ